MVKRFRCLSASVFFFLVFSLGSATAQDDNETCLSCHEDEELTGVNSLGEEFSVYVSAAAFDSSVHAGMDCVECHADLAGTEDYPHDEDVEPVDCSTCHDDVTEEYAHSIHGEIVPPSTQPAAQCWDCHGHHTVMSPSRSDVGERGVNCSRCHQKIAKEYDQSLHGKAVHAGAKLAPRCWDCHGSHDIVSAHSPEARVAKFNIPFMCGRCHKEGSPITEEYDIPEDSILSHYSQSIHGEGLFKKGLMVSAVCSDCHTAHDVRNHNDPQSSIHRDNVARTCQKCHGQIEKVHKKVIRGELWEKEPHKVPVCVDCHSPHQIRRVYYKEGISNQECLKCHAKPDIFKVVDGDTVSLSVDTVEFHNSIHRSVTCAQCHTGATPGLKRPCTTVIPKVDCSICHSEVVATFMTSTHGKLVDRGDPEAPDCIDCHGKHGMKGHKDQSSPTFPTNVPALCSQCHTASGTVGKRRARKGEVCVTDYYTSSIHGKGLLESGLVVTAMCTDCHTAHHELPKSDSASSVAPHNISKTCAQCHKGIYEKFAKSIHSPTVAKTDKPLPTCANCHQSHTIERVDTDRFRQEILEKCGGCHEDVTESYFETVHGKSSKLGYAKAAKCYNCHGAHDILPPDDPNSRLSHQNIVETCGQCHPGSHRQFAGYLTHATHHDRTKYPILYYTFWFMTILLVVTFVLAGTHTLLWLPRSWQMMKKHKELRQVGMERLEYRRFKPFHSVLHVTMVVSFLGLAMTGMTLKFSYLGWAKWLSGMLGGFESAAYIHRICAILTFGYFFAHIGELIYNKRRSKKSWRQILFSENSMLPNKNDWQDLKATIKWFLGLGPRPAYGRWTYWEKFDYFAVFWGVAVIGATGLMLWFPEFFTRFLPGWIINVASIIHSDEALLATGFIFTVHFFNTHFRPEKFPMDTVIFTGRVPLKELEHDRPREYSQLVKSREIKKHLVEPLPPIVVNGIRVFGTIALLIGLALIILIIYAEIFGYR